MDARLETLYRMQPLSVADFAARVRGTPAA